MPDQSCRLKCGCERREFIKLAGAACISTAAGGLPSMAGPFQPKDVVDHFVPADKKLTPEWIEDLFAKGARTFYSGAQLDTIAMPIGGLCAGQLYLAGDGRLMHWDLFNEHISTGYGQTNYQLHRKPNSSVEQGFSIQVQSGNRRIERTLDRQGFPDVRFCGEYPIGTVEYRDPDLPVAVTLEAFSPFIPLNEDDSALPATVMQYTVKNTSEAEVSVTLGGWLENKVCPNSSESLHGARTNRVVRGEGMTMVLGSARPVDSPRGRRKPTVLANFEGRNYGRWSVRGKAFGKTPARGSLPHQQQVKGFLGRGLVNSFRGGDSSQGKLTSPVFKIERAFINFLIGGGGHAGKTCINLLVDRKVVRTAVGKNNEKLTWRHWNVGDLVGKKARIEIVDQESGGWGHINIDHIELDDEPPSRFRGKLVDQADFGTMGLALLGDRDDALASAALPAGIPSRVLFVGDGLPRSNNSDKPFRETLIGALARSMKLAAGEQAKVTFVVTWHFPNRPKHGNYYATRFNSAEDVARYVARHLNRLVGETRLWHDTWYESSLPHWLLDRLFSTTSTLATSTCQWWANGRFWAFEGVGCCPGTCTHVWNYEHTMARLFPRLERSVREMQDFDHQSGFVKENGMIRFRGENWIDWAADGQAGTVLKAYREHQISDSNAFLKRNWLRIRQTLQFLIQEDANSDGLLEGSQHNTYDINFHGPNTMVGSLYLAALRAGEEMAREMRDVRFARICRKIFKDGKRITLERLFNDEYFIQEVDLQRFRKHQYGSGCLSDQLIGQGWAHQVGLGYLYESKSIVAALKSIWKYNWAPNVSAQNNSHPPGRWFASPGEAGLFTCTWPKSDYMKEGVRYKNEVWTGIEYQVAGHMAWEGMVTEALAICRGVHDRYHPSKHNPWNEVECGDHYARGMASYSVFLGLCGFEYHGPKQHIGFAPKLNSQDFRAAFSGSTAWGTISQKRQAGKQINQIDVKWGMLDVTTLSFELPEGAKLRNASITQSGQPLKADVQQNKRHVTATLAKSVSLRRGETIEVELVIKNFERPADGTATDTDREVAEWALGIGGHILNAANGRWYKPQEAAQLDNTKVRLAGINFFSNKKVTDRDLARLSQFSGFEHLNLDQTKITDAGLRHIKNLKSMKGLALSGTAVTDRGVEQVKDFANLTWFMLGAKHVTDRSMQYLEKMSQLEFLFLAGTQVTEDGMRHLANLVQMRELILSNSRVSDRGLKHLTGMKRLRKLGLRGTPVSDAGLVHVGKLTRLRVLELPKGVTDRGLRSLYPLKSLEKLDLRATKATRAGVAALQKELPNCEILR